MKTSYLGKYLKIVMLKVFKAVVDERGIKGATDRLHTIQLNTSIVVKNLKEN